MLENDDKDESLPTAIAGTSIGSGTPHLDLQFQSGIPPVCGSPHSPHRGAAPDDRLHFP